MTPLRTYRLSLKPAEDLAGFLILDWDIAPVSLEDVMLNGVHPYVKGRDTYSLAPAFAAKLNESDIKYPDIDAVGYCDDIIHSPHYHSREDHFEGMMMRVRDLIRFAETLTLSQLVELSANSLRDRWNHHLAYGILSRVHGGFPEMRTFLHKKDRNLRLSGFADLEKYDLSEVVSVEDFLSMERTVLDHGLPVRNFRKASFLSTVTDSYGRLRLHDSLEHITLVQQIDGSSWKTITWHGVRNGERIRFRPDIGACETRRAEAGVFPRGIPKKALCFTATIDEVQELLDTEQATATFPSLNYLRESSIPTAYAHVRAESINVSRIGSFPTSNHTGADLCKVLRTYGKKLGTTKKDFLRNIASLATELYDKHQPEMERFFKANRFVKVAPGHGDAELFPVLEDLEHVQYLVLAMYITQHLRGGAIIDPDFVNDTYGLKDLALSLMTKKVTINSSFLKLR